MFETGLTLLDSNPQFLQIGSGAQQPILGIFPLLLCGGLLLVESERSLIVSVCIPDFEFPLLQLISLVLEAQLARLDTKLRPLSDSARANPGGTSISRRL